MVKSHESLMRVLILELSKYADFVRDDGSEMRWLMGRPVKKVLGYLDYLRIINQTTADIIGFVNIYDYPIWYQFAVHVHEAKKRVWAFTEKRQSSIQYQWIQVYHPLTLLHGCCWTDEIFGKCYLNYEYIDCLGNRHIVKRFNKIHRCYKGIYCEMRGN